MTALPITAGCLGGACDMCPGQTDTGMRCECSCHAAAADLSLPDFLLARYTEEEAVAARADGSAWRAVSEKYPIGAFKGGHLVHVHAPRWRADIEAKRRIVSLHEHDDLDGNLSCGQCDFGGYGRQWCATLRLLALSYADHPDYREEWKP